MTVPYKYQIKGVRQLHKLNGVSLVSWQMGLGKTLLSLLYAQRHPDIRPVVIICPASVKWNWSNEIKIHLGLDSLILEGIRPPKEKTHTDSQFYIINYDILSKRKGKRGGAGWLPQIKKIKPKLLIIDEIHFVSNRTAKRSRAVKDLSQRVPHILGLSGTPITNRPAELWLPLSIIWPDLFPDFFDYANQFCDPKRTFYGWDFSGASNLDELHDKLTNAGMLRLKKTDVLTDLPPKTRIILPVDLSDRREYDRALNDFINWLREQDALKAKKASRAEKLVKIGYIKRLIAKLKLPQVFDWVDNFFQENDEKLILFGIHRDIVESLFNRYSKFSVLIRGGIGGKEKQIAVDKFQEDPKTKLLVGNIDSAGVGLNMTAASNVGIVELPWNPAKLLQAEDRAYRIGTINPVFIYYLLARNTIEEKLCDALTTKQKNISQVLDGESNEDDLDLVDILEEAIRSLFTK